MGRILYINDYGCDNESLNACWNLKYPSNHMWGILDLYRKNGNIRICYVKHYKGFKRLLQLLSVYFKNCSCDVVYSALPGYEWGFLLAKRLGIKKYNIVTVVHHPLSRLPLPNQYNRLVYIGKEVYEKFGKKYDNSEYLFWGPDIDFYPPPSYNILIDRGICVCDFIAAGKTYRDYSLMREGLKDITDSYKIIGDKSSTTNEISYPELIKLYYKSKFVCIPLQKKDKPILMGLTSFIDAIAVGKPILMSDNSMIGIDIEKLNLGKFYVAGDVESFNSSAKWLMSLSDEQYKEMSRRCFEFASSNDYKQFRDRIYQLLDI